MKSLLIKHGCTKGVAANKTLINPNQLQYYVVFFKALTVYQKSTSTRLQITFPTTGATGKKRFPLNQSQLHQLLGIVLPGQENDGFYDHKISWSYCN